MRPEQFQKNFLRQLHDVRPFQQLLDLLPDVGFFMKDRHGRFVMQNRRSCEYCHVDSNLEVVGKTDYDFFPRDRADLYIKQDQEIMKTGIPLINAISLAPEAAGFDRLMVHSKVPLYDRSGRAIGVAGIYREVEGLRATPKSYERLSQAVQYMHTHYSEIRDSQRLAAMAGMSLGEFDRRFRRLFSTTPCQYLLHIRVNAACILLVKTDKKVTEIAQETGFYDHSHFSRTFSKLMKVSPQAYRRRHLPEQQK